MTDTKETPRVRAALPRGLVDRDAADIAGAEAMMAKIRAVYERYGFEAGETPFIEYTEALGKFLPDQDRPNEGVFSFKDDDEQWLSLRYDLTAPLARFVAENSERLPKPYRSYRAGWVFRNEKPGPGRFRQFMQFDADTVGTGKESGPAADAEICMMAADCLEALGIKRGDYVVKVNNRKLLDGVMEEMGLGGEANAGRRMTVMRAIDKLDRLGWGGVGKLLREGRKDESGDFTMGAELSGDQVSQFGKSFEANNAIKVLHALGFSTLKLDRDDNLSIEIKVKGISDKFIELNKADIRAMTGFPEAEGLDDEQVGRIIQFVQTSINMAKTTVDGNIEYDYRKRGRAVMVPIIDWAFFSYYEEALKPGQNSLWEGLDELFEIILIVRSAGFGPDRVRIDPSVVRGLEYYTGPVFEAELTFETPGDDGKPIRFGSVGGGGRYDGLVARFRGEAVPATGFSIGVSRLLAALRAIDSPIVASAQKPGPVVVAVLDRDHMADYQRLVTKLRGAGIAAELYLGDGKMNAQLKYADKRGSLCAVIQGSNEREAAGGREVVIRDLRLGAELAKASKDRADYLELRQRAQFAAPEAELVARVREVLARS
jgi:histidyl-tRNA synthetase